MECFKIISKNYNIILYMCDGYGIKKLFILHIMNLLYLKVKKKRSLSIVGRVSELFFYENFTLKLKYKILLQVLDISENYMVIISRYRCEKNYYVLHLKVHKF